MKPAIVGLFSKVIDLFSKRSKNGEKTQELQEKKLDIFKEALVNVLYVLVALIVLSTIFPSLLSLGDWVYNLTDRIVTYMMY